MHEAQMPDDLPDDMAVLWFLIRRAAGSMDRLGDALFRRELGVSLARFLVLSVVDAHPGPLSQQAVATRLGLTKGTVSRQIDAAVDEGLMTVQVAAHTRRENSLALTDTGAALVRRGDELMAQSRTRMLDAIGPERLGSTVGALGALVQALEQ